jgi:hypothetical protein
MPCTVSEWQSDVESPTPPDFLFTSMEKGWTKSGLGYVRLQEISRKTSPNRPMDGSKGDLKL